MRRFVLAVAAICCALPGLRLLRFGLKYAGRIAAGLLTGNFVRYDLGGGTGEVLLSRSNDPNSYWSNIWFWTFFDAAVLVAACIFLLPLALLLRSVVDPAKRRRSGGGAATRDDP